LEEVGIADLVGTRRAAVELLEHGEQHQGDHQPNSDFREPLIVHRGSFSGSNHYSPTNTPRASTADGNDFMPVKPRVMGSKHRGRQGVSACSAPYDTVSAGAYGGLRPIPTKKVSADLSREALGLIGLTTRNRFLKSFTSWL